MIKYHVHVHKMQCNMQIKREDVCIFAASITKTSAGINDLLTMWCIG